MLRSLVGSEMCIRDRPRQDQFPHPFFPGREEEIVFLLKHGALFANCWICLLYTSDAADDLLCVDLGGRRIIKKKKQLVNTHTNEHQVTRYINEQTELIYIDHTDMRCSLYLHIQ